jgi:hypothetical protein
VWAAAPHPVEQIHFSDLLSFSLPRRLQRHRGSPTVSEESNAVLDPQSGIHPSSRTLGHEGVAPVAQLAWADSA